MPKHRYLKLHVEAILKRMFTDDSEEIDFNTALREAEEIVSDKRVLPIEHEVQIEALRRLATEETIKERPVPRIARNKKQEELLLQAKREARDKYPPDR